MGTNRCQRKTITLSLTSVTGKSNGYIKANGKIQVVGRNITNEEQTIDGIVNSTRGMVSEEKGPANALDIKRNGSFH